ncbi:MAG: hypothetical protein KC609_11225 [Myxococcales bacterium]|nr:hypothetical protein [Myxococcales bacterium]
MKHALLAVFLVAVALTGLNCSDTPPRPTSNFLRPLNMALVCTEGTTVVPLETCVTSSTANLFGYVSNGELGDLAIINLTTTDNVDTDRFTPGFTRVTLGRIPTEITTGPSGQFVFTVNPGDESVTRVDVSTYALIHQKLPGQPYDILIPKAEDGLGNVAYVTMPNLGAVLVLTLDVFSLQEPSSIERIELTGGSPATMVLKRADKKLYVGHLDKNYVSVIDLTSLQEVKKIGLGPECADGIDNDGDGLIDQQDPACRDANGLSERKPETGPYCNDGIDNDGDGLIDAEDPDCQHPETWPQCSDGIDNDGDGKIDFSKEPGKGDPGCKSPFDNSEYSDNPRCSDGIDNDGDGKIDLPDDPDCQGPWDNTEAPLVTACNDGIDNDGDGKIDWPMDPECWGPEADSELPPPGSCTDGIDNDGDGKIDADDPDCQKPPFEEKTPQCTDYQDNDGDGIVDFPFAPGCKSYLDNTEVPECMDGIDNDGDGKIDYPDDPSCYSPYQNSESTKPPLGRVRLAIDPEENLIYALHRGYRSVTAIDTNTDTVIDVNAEEMPGADPLQRRKGIKDIRLGRTPLDVAFVASGEDLLALVAATTGEVVYIDVRRDGRELHRVQDSTTDDVSIAIKPTLTINNEPIDLGFSRDPKFASLGDLQVVVLDEETNQRQYYGLIFSDDVRLQTTEFWTIAYEGIIPGMGDLPVKVMDNLGHVHLPKGGLCEAGVKPGDLLIFKGQLSCGGVSGTYFQYEIESVDDDTVTLKGGSGIVLNDDGSVPANPTAIGLPNVSCFIGAATVEVRANKEWTVYGSVTGFLHEQRNVNGRCVTPETPDPRFSSRAKEATLKAGEVLTVCPIDPASTQVDRYEFSNAVFRFTILPGCEPTDETETEFRLAETPRGTTWTYAVTGAMTAKALIIGTLPRRLIVDPGGAYVYAVDPAGDQVVRLSVIDDTILIYR